MGSNDFRGLYRGTDADAVFSEAVEQSRYESGHGGYTGVIGEKNSFTLITRTPMSAADAEALADQLFEAGDPRVNDKYGPAGAIPVYLGSGGKPVTVVKEITVKLADPAGLPMEPWKLADLITPKVKPLAGHAVQTVDVRDGAVSDARFKTTVETVKGDSRIDYRVSGAGKATTIGTRHLVAADPTDFATLALARAEVTRRVQDCPIPCEVTVTPIPRHTTVKGRKIAVAVTVTAAVTYRKVTPIPAGAKADAWLFFGYASS